MEHQSPRRISGGSVVSVSRDDVADNPLMALVDAASLLDKVQENPTEKKGAEVSCCSSISSKDETKSIDSNEGKVVMGTKEDLYDSSNNKTTFAGECLFLS